MKTETVTISNCKATCLGLLKQLKKKRRTDPRHAERGAGSHGSAATPGGKIEGVDRYRDTGKIVGDIVAPAAEASEWEVLGR